MTNWPVIVINMDNNPQRMDDAAAELSRLGIPFTRFSAVNGREIPKDELARVYDAKANAQRARHGLIPAEIGCYLSHVAVWEQVASGDAEGAILLEDDFVASDTLPYVIEALSSDTGDWEIAKLFSLKETEPVVAQRPLVGTSNLVVPYKVPTTTLGYAIRKDAAARLAAIALPVSRPIDEDHKHFWELNLRVALVTPPPLRFREETISPGSIQSARRRARGLTGLAAIAQAWRSLRYRARYFFGLHWHRLIRRAR